MIKTNNNLILITAILYALGTNTACQTKTESKMMAANQSVVQQMNKTKQTENTKMENTKTEVDKPDASLSSPTEAYKTAHALREAKDLNGLKKVLSKQMLDFLTEMGKSENKTLDDQLKELVAQPQAATAESRNERIVGDLAALEYLEDGKWKLMGFIKEDGGWKMTIPDSKISAIMDAPR
jgi:Zn-dependent oligopeptidase